MSDEKILINSSDENFKRQKTDNFTFSKYVSIKFVNQDNEETFFKVLRNAKLGKAFAAYSRFHKLDYHVDFLFNGDRVNRSLTPDDLDIEDGDAFDVLKHVHGGGFI
ncbi:Small ubiquitin-related modifier 2 [Bienertia sinuspersici]